MLPLGLFGDRTFSASNLMTFLVYAALGAIPFFLVLQLQTVLGYGALRAGAGTLPITICMIFLAGKGGELGSRIGPRIPMTVGPMVMALGALWLTGVGEGVSYWTHVLPPLTLFGLGLALMVATLTATVLAAAPDRHAGIASGVNNAVARSGSLIAVAALPLAVGPHRRGVRRPGRARRRLRPGHADLRGDAGRRRALRLVADPQPPPGGDRVTPARQDRARRRA